MRSFRNTVSQAGFAIPTAANTLAQLVGLPLPTTLSHLLDAIEREARVAFFNIQDPDVIVLENFNDTVVVRLAVPKGQYVVFGKVSLRNSDGDPQNATARLTSQDGFNIIDQADIRVGRSEGIFHSTNFTSTNSISVQGTFTVDGEGEIVDIRCATFRGNVSQASLIAIGAENLAVTTAASSLVQLKNFQDTVVASVRLQRGTHAVFGKVVLSNQDGDSQNAKVQLAARNGGIILQETFTLLEALSAGNSQSILILGTATVEGDADVVDLRCATFDGKANLASLIAIAVDDLRVGNSSDGDDGLGGFILSQVDMHKGNHVLLGSLSILNFDTDDQGAIASLSSQAGTNVIDRTTIFLGGVGSGGNNQVVALQGVVNIAGQGESVKLSFTTFRGNVIQDTPTLIAIGVVNTRRSPVL
jgi:hypothetical protein